jgi:hypothetical protein
MSFEKIITWDFSFTCSSWVILMILTQNFPQGFKYLCSMRLGWASCLYFVQVYAHIMLFYFLFFYFCSIFNLMKWCCNSICFVLLCNRRLFINLNGLYNYHMILLWAFCHQCLIMLTMLSTKRYFSSCIYNSPHL